MKKAAIISLIIFAMSILATSASAQPSACDPLYHACVTQLTGCDSQFNVCEQTNPGQGPGDPIFHREGGMLQQEIQQSNETFTRLMNIMRTQHQTRINIIHGF